MSAPVDLTRAPDPTQAILATAATDILYGPSPDQSILNAVAQWRDDERTGASEYGENRERLLGRLRTLQDRKDGVS